jgi:hypothetical protein
VFFVSSVRGKINNEAHEEHEEKGFKVPRVRGFE